MTSIIGIKTSVLGENFVIIGADTQVTVLSKNKPKEREETNKIWYNGWGAIARCESGEDSRPLAVFRGIFHNKKRIRRILEKATADEIKAIAQELRQQQP